MDDKELCKAFGTTLEEVDRDVEEFEHGRWEGYAFGEPIEGRPQPKMRNTSIKLYDFELTAVDRAAKEAGVSRSAFIRKAINDELVAIA